ncbi:MAG: ABC transporter ATP-binding protein [Phycisphaerales bacterium]|nr:ABC transporter ATP-binding protein [Phycisphaerales bacterium]
MPLIAAKDVHKTYRLGRVDVPVLHGVDLSVDEGECVAILGASGSGKSTLLHILGGLDRPDRGRGAVEFRGSPLHGFSAGALDRYRNHAVGFVFQFYHLLPELTVLQNTLLPALVGLGRLEHARRRGAINARAGELLALFGLGHRLNHRPVELSGGERQRVALARALMNQPALLLADEPTGNLDQATGATILDALMGFKREQRQSMVIVTHDPRTAERADRVVRLVDGRVAG